jgi:hypothetical protein
LTANGNPIAASKSNAPIDSPTMLPATTSAANR